jgi:glycosyltransferase involved in cell wall biosynthesis
VRCAKAPGMPPGRSEDKPRISTCAHGPLESLARHRDNDDRIQGQHESSRSTVKVLMLSPAGAGGVHQYTWLLCGALEAAGVEVTLAVRDGHEQVPAPGPSRILTLEGRRQLASWPQSVGTVLRAARWHDVCHVQAPLWSLGDSALLLRGLRSPRRLLAGTLHELLPYRRRLYHDFVYRHWWSAFDAVAVHGHEQAARLASVRGRSDGIAIVPFGDHGPALGSPDLQASPRRLLDLAPDRPLILFFGLVRPHKGLADLIDALEGTAAELTLLVVGEPLEPLDAYREQALARGVDLRLDPRYLRYLPGPTVATCLTEADVLVLPYRDGSNSGVLALTGHFRVPTVVTHVVAPPEHVARVPPQGVCPPRDPVALRQAIEKGVRGELAAPERFAGWSEVADGYLRLWTAEDGAA